MMDSPDDLIRRLQPLPAEEREAFLQGTGFTEIERDEVRARLDEADAADAYFGEQPGRSGILAVRDSEPEFGRSEAEGDRVGPYHLRQQIGEGGFGIVWMAEQIEPISRMVALKVIKAGMDTKEVLARFEAERQALAMMDHPNIARVLDAGATASGRPYFAMELVKGIPITRFCDEQGLGTRARLELFKEVCAAVLHAHQKGIIHRDIKPSNVLVTLHGDKPVPKVIDFGIAKAMQSKLTDKTLFTRFEQFLGTPVYMSPEQTALSGLDIDTRSDIYSLGVLLYELLAGAPPFDQMSLLSEGYDEMRRIIREEDPPTPSTRLSQTGSQSGAGHRTSQTITSHALRGELDWMVMKAIEKDRTRRYQSASAFAADIARFLNDEPVLAAAPSAVYKFKKFTKRHKAVIGVMTAMLGLLLAGIVATGWQAVRANAEKERAVGAEELAEQRLAASEEAREEAEMILEFLTDMFESSRPGVAEAGREVTVAEVMGQALKRLETELAGQPERRARLLLTIGSTYHALGLHKLAIPPQEEVLDYYREHLGPEHPRTLMAMNSLGASFREAGRRKEGLEMLEEALELSRRVNGPEHPDTLTLMHSLGSSYFEAGRRDEALAIQEEVLALRRKVHGSEHPGTLAAMDELASTYHVAGRFEEALETRVSALELFRKALGPEHPDTLTAMNNLAESYRDTGRLKEALELEKRGLELQRKVSGPEHPDTLGAMNDLARVLLDAGELKEALLMFEELLALARKVHGPEHPRMVTMMNHLAICYNRAGRRDEALVMLEEALALSRKVNGPEHPLTLSATSNLAYHLSLAGRVEEVLALRETVLRLSRKVLGAENPETLGAMVNLATSYNKAGRVDEAIELQEQGLEVMRRVLPRGHPSLRTAIGNLSAYYGKAGRDEEAKALWKEFESL